MAVDAQRDERHACSVLPLRGQCTRWLYDYFVGAAQGFCRFACTRNFTEPYRKLSQGYSTRAQAHSAGGEPNIGLLRDTRQRYRSQHRDLMISLATNRPPLPAVYPFDYFSIKAGGLHVPMEPTK